MSSTLSNLKAVVYAFNSDVSRDRVVGCCNNFFVRRECRGIGLVYRARDAVHLGSCPNCRQTEAVNRCRAAIESNAEALATLRRLVAAQTEAYRSNAEHIQDERRRGDSRPPNGDPPPRREQPPPPPEPEQARRRPVRGAPGRGENGPPPAVPRRRDPDPSDLGPIGTFAWDTPGWREHVRGMSTEARDNSE